MSSNTNPMAKIYILTIPTYTFIPNLIVNNAALSTGGRGNWTVSQNKNMMDTSTNAMA